MWWMVYKIKGSWLVLVPATILCFLLLETAFRIFFCCYLTFSIDPRTYWSLNPDQAGYVALGGERANVGSDGHRVDSATIGAHNVIFIGDSFTFGQSVSDNETFPYLVEKWLNKGNQSVNVINLAVPGWGPYQCLQALNSSIGLNVPETVVYVVSSFDMERQRMSNERFYFLQRSIMSVLGKSQFLRFLFDMSSRATGSNFGTTGNYVSGDLADLFAINEEYIREMSTISNTYGADFVILQYPSSDGNEFAQLLRGHCESINATCILDLASYFDDFSENQLNLPDGHPTPLAHHVTAWVMLHELEQSLDPNRHIY
jgi:hypothetical protein